MAAILCRVFFIEPCKALGRCINQCCKCCDSICEEIGKCCNYVCELFERPFSGCLLISLALNLGAIIYSILSLTDGTYSKDCDVSSGTMDIYLIVLIVLAIFNGLFSYYIFYYMNTDEMRQLYDPYYSQNNNNMNNGNNSNDTIGKKAWDFFANNPYFAAWICCVFIPTCVFMTLSLNARCPHSSKSDGLYWSSMFMLIFLIVGALIMTSYIFLEGMKQASQECCWWFVPCAWPCLCIGVIVNMLESEKAHHPAPTRQDYIDQANRPVRGQPNKNKQQAAKPVQQPLVAVAIVPSNPQPQPQPQPPPENPFRPGIQPHYTNNGQSMQAAAASAPPEPYYTNAQSNQSQPVAMHSAPQMPVSNNNNNNNRNEPGASGQKDNAQAAKDVAKAGGALAVKGGKAAIGFMARGLNKLNDKLNENNNPPPAANSNANNNYREGAEGEGGIR